MSMSDPVADMLTRIRNAQMAEKSIVQIPSSNLIKSIAQVLKDEGYVNDFNIHQMGNKKIIEISLKYYAGLPVIEKIQRVSKPGLRIYKSSNDLPNILDGLGIAIISTSKGVMTDRNARLSGVGGEVLCVVT
jgi:small subunit ribosomal protein S8